MFTLVKMKSASGIASRAVPPSIADIPLASTVERPTFGAEKCQGASGEEPPKKKCKVAVSKWSGSVANGSTQVQSDKGKGSTEAEEVPNYGYSLWELCEVDDRARADRQLSPARGGGFVLDQGGDTSSVGLKVEGSKVITQYKVSRGFESGLEKMGRVSYEFGYRVALERFRAKYRDSTIEENPYAELSEDMNMKMDLC
ncbi:hypothetical protein BHM03_00062789 [Ensete ventricosum]|uniref:Uncharacterized protein n=1 Tax=Ensete ventricosum TaxID=4639 RepID=A0A445MMW4_ENSVE|nr:hypothetical protein BHM03_00062789 [Ensete ventricosum]